MRKNLGIMALVATAMNISAYAEDECSFPIKWDPYQIVSVTKADGTYCEEVELIIEKESQEKVTAQSGMPAEARCTIKHVHQTTQGKTAMIHLTFEPMGDTLPIPPYCPINLWGNGGSYPKSGTVELRVNK